eukprot:11157190-Lingulodinium_polyedra.AAC.1
MQSILASRRDGMARSARLSSGRLGSAASQFRAGRVGTSNVAMFSTSVCRVVGILVEDGALVSRC